MFFGHNMYITEKPFLCYLLNWSIVAFEKQLIIYLILNQSIVFVSLYKLHFYASVGRHLRAGMVLDG